MKRRVAVIIVTALGLSGTATGAQALLGNTTASTYWGCAVVDRADTALCLKNPLPERLPIPATPALPSTPS